jgi:predicted patatin/cPLA2 family phospholipase
MIQQQPVALRRTLARNDLPIATGDRHPLIGLLLTRHAEGSRRASRADQAVIALAIEGGGSRGVVSAGMCLLLEKTGLIDAVDVIYGTSSGALNGSFTAAGQAALGATNYLDTANPQFANPLRMLTGRAVVDFDFLFNELISRRKPYDPEGLAAGPSFRALGVDLATAELEVLRDFADVEELMAAVRVSCSLPLLSGAPVSFRGKPMVDGSLIESMPYASALTGGATHVLVLRSRPAGYRKDHYPRTLIEFARRTADPAIAPLMRDRPDRYNAEAEHLERVAGDTASLVQVAPPAGAPKVGQFERSGQLIRGGLLTGASAAAAAFGLPPVDVLWQPELYGTP